MTLRKIRTSIISAEPWLGKFLGWILYKVEFDTRTRVYTLFFSNDWNDLKKTKKITPITQKGDTVTVERINNNQGIIKKIKKGGEE